MRSRHTARDDHPGSSSSKIFHQHDVRFREFVLNVENRFAVARHGHPPTRLFLQGPDGNDFVSRKIEELNCRVRRLIKSQEVNAIGGKCPIRPAAAPNFLQHLSFFPAPQGHSPHAARFVLGIIEEASIERFDAGNSTILS